MTLNLLNKDIDKFHQVLDQVSTIDQEGVYQIKPDVGSGKFHRYSGEFWDLYIGDFKLMQDIYFKRYPDPENTQQYSISFQAFKGRITESDWSNPNIKRAGEGIVFYSNNAQISSFWHRNIECSMVYLSFSSQWMEQLEQQKLMPKISRETLLQRPNPIFHVPLTTDTKHSISQIFHPPKEISKDFLSSYLYTKVVDLVIQAASGCIQRINDQVSKYAIHPDDLNTLEEVKLELINNYQDPPSISALVEQTGMSKSKLQRLFQTVYKTSVYQFTKSIRMEKAMELLMQGFSVTEAAYDVGYSSIPNFSVAFKECYNIQASQVATR